MVSTIHHELGGSQVSATNEATPTSPPIDAAKYQEVRSGIAAGADT